MTNRSLSISAISSRSLRRTVALAAGYFLLTGLAPVALATVATTTQLSIPVPSVAVGAPTLLVATVTDASSNPVLQGTVVFYDRERMLGKAQIVSRAGGSFTQGTANFKTASFTPGGNSITAVFAGTKTDASSTSAPVTVTVTGPVPTSLTLAETPVDGLETLIATLQTYGEPKLTGSVDFMDLTKDTTLGTLPLTEGQQSADQQHAHRLGWNRGKCIRPHRELGRSCSGRL
jgi:Bacterial Ig-like domain (group 3)